jgi:bifunctional oligoribonuclease and PAP phosphatase NrnA
LKRFDPILCEKLNGWLLACVKRSVIIPHINPDGDALGSAFALNRIMVNADIQSVIISPGEFPSYLNWMGKYAKALIYENNNELCHQFIDEADVLFFLDFNDIRRLGKLSDYIGKISKPIILIDHHPEPEIKANWLFSDIDVSSTAELVYDFLEETRLLDYIDKESSEALLTGIMADTGSFSHNASRAGMYRIVGKLIEMGANKEKINTLLFNDFSEKRMRLLGHCLSQKMEIFPLYHAALIWLSKKELIEYDFHPGDTEGFVNYPLSIKGIVFSAFFMEMSDVVKISFRSKGNFAANEFSTTHFCGGGHKNAAGGEIKLPMADALNLFRQVLPMYENQLNEETMNLL